MSCPSGQLQPLNPAVRDEKTKVILGRRNKWTVMANLRKDKTINPVNQLHFMDASNTKQNWQMHYNSQDDQHFPTSFRAFVLQVCPCLDFSDPLPSITWVLHPSSLPEENTFHWRHTRKCWFGFSTIPTNSLGPVRGAALCSGCKTRDFWYFNTG